MFLDYNNCKYRFQIINKSTRCLTHVAAAAAVVHHLSNVQQQLDIRGPGCPTVLFCPTSSSIQQFIMLLYIQVTSFCIISALVCFYSLFLIAFSVTRSTRISLILSKNIPNRETVMNIDRSSFDDINTLPAAFLPGGLYLIFNVYISSCGGGSTYQ